MAIVVLVLWLVTVTAGITLLRAGGAGRRTRLAGQAAAATIAAAQNELTPADAAPTAVWGPAQARPARAAPALAARLAARPLTAEGNPPAGPHVRVQTPDGEHPLLEFSHPALAVTGVACWMMFTFVHYRPLAWIAVAVLAATLLIGVAWFTRNRLASRRQASAGWSFPPPLIWLHGALAASSLLLAVLAAVVASRG